MKDVGLRPLQENIKSRSTDIYQKIVKPNEEGKDVILRNRSNLNHFILPIFLCVLLLASTISPKTVKATESSAESAPILSEHPIYSNYKFDNNDDVINFGVQPLYSSTGLIIETMKRDSILNENLRRHGMDVKFYAFLKGNDVNYFLQQGDLDVGIGGDMPAITAAATMDIIVPALVQLGFTSVVAKRSMLMSELTGKKIAYAIGSNAHYALLSTLTSMGISDTQIKLIPMDVNQMSDALQAGKITAFSAWEPVPTMSIVEHPKNVAIHRNLVSGYLYFTKSLSDKYPEIIRQILTAEIRALRWMQDDRQNLMKASEWAIQAIEGLTNDKFNLTVVQNADIAMDDILGLDPVPIIPQDSLRQGGSLYSEFEFLKSIGNIPVSINWNRIYKSFDTRILVDILKNVKDYKFNEFKYDIE